MAVGDAHVFPGFLTPVLTQLFFPKPPTAFLTCFCRGERRKYTGKKSCLNRGSNSQPPGHEFNTLTTELSGRGSTDVHEEAHVFTCSPIRRTHLPCLEMVSMRKSVRILSTLGTRIPVYSGTSVSGYSYVGTWNNSEQELLSWLTFNENI